MIVESVLQVEGVEYVAVLLIVMCAISAFSLASIKEDHQQLRRYKTIERSYDMNQEQQKGFKIEHILERRKEETQNELQEYKLPEGREWRELQFSPVRSVILSTWRSGSTFLGDILDSHPANFYFYEPLSFLDMERYEKGIHDVDVARFLEDLFKCNLTGKWSDLMLKEAYLFHHMKRVWEHCHGNLKLCRNKIFLSSLCHILPFQSMKLVRLPLKEIDGLLMNQRLGVRVMYLVRDPRATMASRRKRSWCKKSLECYDPNILCRQMEDDYHTAAYFTQMFPHTFRIGRYEDIAMDVNRTVPEILHFFQRNMSKQTRRYLTSHTSKTKGGTYDTYRDSKKVATQWTKTLKKYEILSIQASCEKAMQLYGYRKLQENQTIQQLNPLMEFSVSPGALD